MKKKNNLLVGIIIALVIILLIIVLIPEQKEDTIKVGAIFPLTGDTAPYGISDMEGAELAIEGANKEGGINGKSIELLIEDSKGDPKEGLSAFRKLVEVDEVKVVMTELSSVSMAIAPLIKEEKVIMFSIAGHPELTGQSEFIFRNYPTNAYTGKITAELVMEKLNLKRVGIMYANDEWGVSLANAFKESFSGLSIMEGFNVGDKDFRTQITKVKAENPEAIFIINHGNANLGIAIKQIKELEYDGILLSTLEASYPDVLETAGDSIDGLIYSDLYIDYEKNPKAKELKEKYTIKYNKDPDLSVALTYDMTNMLLFAIKETEYNPESIKNELLKIKDFEGVFGKLNINEVGDVEFTSILKTIKNGEFVEYEE